MSEPRPPLPPFDVDTAIQKVQAAEDAWNSRDPHRVSLGYTEDSVWRNRDTFLTGRVAIVEFLTTTQVKAGGPTATSSGSSTRADSCVAARPASTTPPSRKPSDGISAPVPRINEVPDTTSRWTRRVRDWLVQYILVPARTAAPATSPNDGSQVEMSHP